MMLQILVVISTSGRSTAYLSSFLVVASNENLSLQYVNSKNKTFGFGFGENGGLDVGVAPKDAQYIGAQSCQALVAGEES